MKEVHNVLLVGEGNFSFSASLCEKSDANTHITATCYESEEEVTKQENASSNIRHLREKGAEVHFQLDCTKLQHCPALTHRVFDCIIFNFPHCGRKAGVKKNRELLAKFFLSCAEVLTEKGEVHVALCRGQGGTPADQPVREWHNSWQVVAMAAGAGFILSEVHPVGVDEHCGYKSTGYRSQDKSFHIEGALNHVFTRGVPIGCPKPVTFEAKCDEEWISFQVSEELVEKINRNHLDSSRNHPIRVANELLIKEISKIFPVQKLDNSFSFVVRGSFSTASFSGCKDSLSSVYFISPIGDEDGNEEHVENKSVLSTSCTDVLSLAGLYLKDNYEETRDSGPMMGMPTRDPDSTKYCLRPSLLVHVHKIIQRPDFKPETLYTLSVPVFRKCLVSSYTLPVYHEIVFIWGSTADPGSEFVHSFRETVLKSITSILQSVCDHTVKYSEEELKDYRSNDQTWFVNIKELPAEKQCSIYVNISRDSSYMHDVHVGHVCVVPSGQLHKELGFCIAILNLDLLTMLGFGILDWRMLWTFDERFINQFHHLEVGPFKNFSLYPPSFAHDISFWVKPGKQFDELEFHTIARCVTGEMVKDITLIDSFEHPETGQASRCYRVTYQSCDKALSYQKALELQLCLREKLQKCLEVTLR